MYRGWIPLVYNRKTPAMIKLVRKSDAREMGDNSGPSCDTECIGAAVYVASGL